jgi:hypothetical protein
MRERKTFSREYSLAPVKQFVERGLTYAQVSRDLGIRVTCSKIRKRLLKRMERFQKQLRDVPDSMLNANGSVRRIAWPQGLTKYISLPGALIVKPLILKVIPNHSSTLTAFA